MRMKRDAFESNQLLELIVTFGLDINKLRAVIESDQAHPAVLYFAGLQLV